MAKFIAIILEYRFYRTSKIIYQPKYSNLGAKRIDYCHKRPLFYVPISKVRLKHFKTFFFFHFIILWHGKRQCKTKNYKHFLDWAHDDRLLSVVRSCINVLFRPYISNNNSLHNPTSVSETCRLPCNQLVFDYPTISRWTNSVIPQYQHSRGAIFRYADEVKYPPIIFRSYQ